MQTSQAAERPELAKYGLIRIGIGAEHLDKIALLLEFDDGLGDFAVFLVPFAIDEEIIFPGAAFVGPGLDLGHVQLESAEGGQRLVQCPDLVRDAEHEAGAVAAGGRAALAPKDEEAGGVGG